MQRAKLHSDSDSSDTMLKKRGGQRKHWAERARVWTWYHEIKRRGDWSDYLLDYEFAWTEEGKAVREDAEHRPRTFEWIRKKARKPKGRDWRWRTMDDLVAAVDAHRLFKGTEALYRSDLWDLLQRPLIPPDEVLARTDRLLKTHGLVRVDPRRHDNIANLIAKHEDKVVLDWCLRLSLRRMDYLSGIVLIWLLYLQAEPPANWRCRSLLADLADSMLDQYFDFYFPLNPGRTYYTDAIHTLEQSRLDLSSARPLRGYGFLETMGIWPILPQDRVASMDEEQMFTVELFRL